MEGFIFSKNIEVLEFLKNEKEKRGAQKNRKEIN